ncbi:uncharacterized protein E0L32_004951 [Thyridium curvatum]|uniref:Uncharacterized protein n=1 Tax=Thyridium curvatum TaxID=1093900 RepID=A0A507AY08_9PEZI|nr:uncharacterized protein E0L32_004951 [Thyridium curvatum]TPX14842.1 hypothetical protein E0L32_004951 [Thyridium curvatum]
MALAQVRAIAEDLEEVHSFLLLKCRPPSIPLSSDERAECDRLQEKLCSRRLSERQDGARLSRNPAPEFEQRDSQATELPDWIDGLIEMICRMKVALASITEQVRSISRNRATSETESRRSSDVTTAPTSPCETDPDAERMTIPLTYHRPAGESTATSGDSPSPPSNRAAGASAIIRPTPTLQMAQLGEAMVTSLRPLVHHGSSVNKIKVSDFKACDWADTVAKRKRPEDDTYQVAVKWSSSKLGSGLSHLKLAARGREFLFPTEPAPAERPTVEEAREYLDELVENPPRGDIAYYVGPSLTDGFDGLLHPGQDLLGLGEISGVNTVWEHIGPKNSGTAAHCEDTQLYSCNYVCYGLKIWLILPEEETVKFERFVKSMCPSADCDQFVRHASLMVSPARLEAEGIKFDIEVCGPGEMIVTRPRCYHQVVNFSTCLAIAINFTLPGEPIIPENTPVCPECGFFPLEHPNLRQVQACRVGLEANTRKRSQRSGETNVGPSLKKKRQGRFRGGCEPTTQALETTLRDLQKLSHIWQAPSIENNSSLTPHLLKLAAAIMSEAATEQFRQLIQASRQLGARRPPVTIRDTVKDLVGAHGRSDLDKLRVRLLETRLAQTLEDLAKGGLRAAPGVTTALINELQCSQSIYERLRRNGNRWKTICRPYQGLQCLVPFSSKGHPFGVSQTDYMNLVGTENSEEEIQAFHALLDNEFFINLCSAAASFQKAMLYESDDVEFMWESSKRRRRAKTAAAALLELQPFPTLNENMYDAENFKGTSPPDGWPEEWSWPVDPTHLYSGRHCDLCDQDECRCVDSVSQPRPRIKYYGAKGRGLQAVASTEGETAYRKDDIIGYLNGEILPVGTRADVWTLDFARPDIQGEPFVCKIHCGRRGNSFRLLNHSCQPNAVLTQKRVSGRYRTSVVALGDIPDGAEITVSYPRERIPASLCGGNMIRKAAACVPLSYSAQSIQIRLPIQTVKAMHFPDMCAV